MGASAWEDRTSFVQALGLEAWRDGEDTHGALPLDDAVAGAASGRPLTGLAAVLADVVLSNSPEGLYGPTVDLHLQLLGPLPRHGRLHAVGRPIKVGRRLVVAEARLDVDGAPCGRAVGTFLHQHVSPVPLEGLFPVRASRPPRPPSFEAVLAATHPDAASTRVVAAAPLRNGEGGTVQGGIQAIIAELAAGWALGSDEADAGGWVPDDLDVRYLGVVREGPVLATAEVVARDGDRGLVHVRLHDEADGGLVAFVALRCGRGV